jgi:Domain of unknown function (DUF4390)
MRQPFSSLLTHCARLLSGAALLLVVSLPALLPGAARAEEDEPLAETPRFDVRSAYLEPVDGVLDLNATLDLSLSKNALQALRSGVPLSFQLDLSLNRKRRYLPDEGVAHLVQRWRLQYHALSERYVVTNQNTGQQTTYATLEAALTALSTVRRLPVLDQALLEKRQRYEASARIVMEVEGGLPDALRIMMFWIDWKRSSDWYTWTVRP